MVEPMIITVLGRACAGKTTMAGYLSKKYGFETIEASTVFKTKSGLNIGGLNDLEYSTKAYTYLKQHGLDFVAREVSHLISQSLRRQVVVVGFRFKSEVRFFRNEFPLARMIMIASTDKLRFDRYLKRKRDGCLRTMNEFLGLDACFGPDGIHSEREGMWERIHNNGSLTQYYDTIERTIDTWLSHGGRNGTSKT